MLSSSAIDQAELADRIKDMVIESAEEVVLLSNITVGETAAATVVVAAFAIGQSIWTTLRTGRASREDRLWQRRAEVYVDLLTWAIRQRELSTITPAEWLSEHERDELPSAAELIALEAKVAAFASAAVGKKVDELQEVWDALRVAWGDLDDLKKPGVDKSAMRDMFSISIGQPEDRAVRLSQRVKKWADELVALVSDELNSGSSALRSRSATPCQGLMPPDPEPFRTN